MAAELSRAASPLWSLTGVGVASDVVSHWLWSKRCSCFISVASWLRSIGHFWSEASLLRSVPQTGGSRVLRSVNITSWWLVVAAVATVKEVFPITHLVPPLLLQVFSLVCIEEIYGGFLFVLLASVVWTELTGIQFQGWVHLRVKFVLLSEHLLMISDRVWLRNALWTWNLHQGVSKLVRHLLWVRDLLRHLLLWRLWSRCCLLLTSWNLQRLWRVLLCTLKSIRPSWWKHVRSKLGSPQPWTLPHVSRFRLCHYWLLHRSCCLLWDWSCGRPL